MHVKRTATIVVAGGALLAWFSAAMTPTERRTTFTPSARAAVAASSAQLAIETARLHERLRPDAVPRQPSRNLFTFHVVAPRAPAPVVAARPALSEAQPAPAPPMPPLTLAGIAEDPGPSGPIRTAVISGGGQLFLVKEGENVTPRYRVAKISPEVVELADLGDGSTRRLALK
jgi:hypothetical protein